MHATNHTEEIITLFKKHGAQEYGEQMSVLSHSFQAGLHAKAMGLDEELIIGAFLHDIGHLCPLEQAKAEFETMGEFGIEAHDQWGRAFLKSRGFSDRIVAVVYNHVAAKRYLCRRDETYYAELSEASKNTLAYQGGMMSEAEASAFENQPFFEESILIRKIDEAAKETDYQITAEHWAYFEQLLNGH
jgi:putative nucleotidyltransferase with HDIG domain